MLGMVTSFAWSDWGRAQKSKDGWSAGQILNLVTPKCEAGVQPTDPLSLVYMVLLNNLNLSIVWNPRIWLCWNKDTV